MIQWPNDSILESQKKLFNILKQWEDLKYLESYYKRKDENLENFLESLQTTLKYTSIVYMNGYLERILNSALAEDIKIHSQGWHDTFITEMLRKGTNPRWDHIKNVIQAINYEKLEEVNKKLQKPGAFLDKHTLTGFESIRNATASRNNVAHMRDLQKVESLRENTVIDLIQFVLNFGEYLCEVLNPNLKPSANGLHFNI